mgnify:CR=1 FL=1
MVSSDDVVLRHADSKMLVWNPLRSRGRLIWNNNQVWQGAVLQVRITDKPGTVRSSIQNDESYSWLILTRKQPKCNYILVEPERVSRFVSRSPITRLQTAPLIGDIAAWARDKKRNVYLFRENAVLTRIPPDQGDQNPYAWYLAHHAMAGPALREQNRGSRKKLVEVNWFWSTHPIPTAWRALYVPIGNQAHEWTKLSSPSAIRKFRTQWGKSHGFYDLMMKTVAGDAPETYWAFAMELDECLGRFVRNPLSAVTYGDRAKSLGTIFSPLT